MDFVATTLGDAEDLAAEIEAAWSAFFTTEFVLGTDVEELFWSQTELNQITVYPLDSMVAPTITVPASGIGGTIATALPADVALVITKRTQTRGRAGRGRNYLGGLSTAIMQANSSLFIEDISPGLSDAWDSQFFVIDNGTNVYEQVVITQATNPTGEANFVTSFSVDRNPDTQRRRGQG